MLFQRQTTYVYMDLMLKIKKEMETGYENPASKCTDNYKHLEEIDFNNYLMHCISGSITDSCIQFTSIL